MQASAHRFRFIDTLRGFSLVSMVAFHTCYDIAYVYGLGADWFRPPLQTIWRFSISWTFLILAGWMCNLSRSNLKRSLRYLGVAALIFIATSLAAVDDPISYGIIYCMGASTLIWAGLERLKLTPHEDTSARKAFLVAALFFVAYLVLIDVNVGLVHLGPITLRVPNELFDCGFLSWLGFPGPHFVSSDYYPPLPYTLLFLAGGWLGHGIMRNEQATEFLEGHGLGALEFLGQHSLLVYLIHQPVVVGILELITRLS